MADDSVQNFLAVILQAHPQLAAQSVTVCAQGFDSLALDIGGAWIFKQPRNGDAESRLIAEAALLDMLAGRVSLKIPRMQILPGTPRYSRHAKLEGGQLPPAAYAGLDGAARRRLGAVLGQFYADLHSVPPDRARQNGARDVGPWWTPDQIAVQALPRLEPALQRRAVAALAAYAALPPDPFGQIYGHFDGHGWNMAFDFSGGNLTGVYDFADSGICDLHREFVYPSMIAPDLTARIVTAYEGRTGRRLGRARIALLTAVHRLWELAEANENLPQMLENVLDWFAGWPGPGSGAPLELVDVPGEL